MRSTASFFLHLDDGRVLSVPADEAPRGMGFLFSRNRLNVATSRAQALAVVVANRAVFEPECRTPEQMKLANAFCRFREMAGA